MKERREKGLNNRLNINILDKRHEDYRYLIANYTVFSFLFVARFNFMNFCLLRAPTPPPYVAFGGEGTSLGTVDSGGTNF